MLKKIVLALVVLVIAFAAFVAMRPADFRIARSRSVAAPPDVVYPYINDFHNWTRWSPWEKLDPSMKREYSGPQAGPGASYRWAGNNDVGSGRMTITDSRPNQGVTMRLEFTEPFAATNTTQFDLAPSGTGTNVTWAMGGHNNFMAKAAGVFMDMDTLVGGDFEKGLANLDAATAAGPAPAKAPASR